jgi:glutaredoxin-related protein
MRDGCHYSSLALHTLKSLDDVSVDVYLLGRDFDRKQFNDYFGEGSTYPRVYRESVLIGGCSETLQCLRNEGYDV